MQWFCQAELPKKKVADGILLSAVWGDGAMITFFDLAEGAVIPTHSHTHEQISFVIKGELLFTVDGQTHHLRAGDGCVIAPNEPHSVTVISGPAQALDAWHPIRDDYRIS